MTPLFLKNSIQKCVRIGVRKDLLPKYSEDLKKAIISFFPIKEVYKTKVVPTNKQAYEMYILRYTKKGTTITVDCDYHDEVWDKFDFMFDTFKN
jgi:hypothetical protein